jgi:hypothetical protein
VKARLAWICDKAILFCAFCLPVQPRRKARAYLELELNFGVPGFHGPGI